jgi:outer membrane immunogenic protein
MKRYITWLIDIVIILMALFIVYPVFAADLPYKAVPRYGDPVVPPVAYTWTGFYVGLNGGAGFGMDSAAANSVSCSGCSSSSFNLPLSSQPTSGWLGGFTIGYNWQTGPIVLGLEGDFDWTDINGSNVCLMAFSCSVKQTWLGDFAGRVGFATPNIPMLLYVKAGIAWSDFSYGFGNTFNGTTISSSASDTRMGGLLGMGVEYAFLTNWTAKIEYDFIDFGSNNESFPLAVSGCSGCTLPTIGASIRDTESLMKAGINYKFNF